MPTTKTADTVLVPVVQDVPRISDAERAELLASLDQAAAQIEAGDFDEIGPDTLRREFQAILEENLSDAELDALLGISRPGA